LQIEDEAFPLSTVGFYAETPMQGVAVMVRAVLGSLGKVRKLSRGCGKSSIAERFLHPHFGSCAQSMTARRHES
jgi:hypothetical protein